MAEECVDFLVSVKRLGLLIAREMGLCHMSALVFCPEITFFGWILDVSVTEKELEKYPLFDSFCIILHETAI